jgi:hypothetical protein
LSALFTLRMDERSEAKSAKILIFDEIIYHFPRKSKKAKKCFSSLISNSRSLFPTPIDQH